MMKLSQYLLYHISHMDARHRNQSKCNVFENKKRDSRNDLSAAVRILEMLDTEGVFGIIYQNHRILQAFVYDSRMESCECGSPSCGDQSLFSRYAVIAASMAASTFDSDLVKKEAKSVLPVKIRM